MILNIFFRLAQNAKRADIAGNVHVMAGGKMQKSINIALSYGLRVRFVGGAADTDFLTVGINSLAEFAGDDQAFDFTPPILQFD